MSEEANCWPTEKQQLLLNAALQEGEKSHWAWEKYCREIDFLNLEYISSTLLPLAYQKFKDSSSKTEFQLKICKSVYRHTWCQNQLLLFQLTKVLEILEKASISACLLKGAAMIHHYYKDAGLRVMGDIDLLIPHNQIRETLQKLSEVGWESDLKKEKIENLIQYAHAIALKNKEGHSLDIHWSVLANSGLDARFSSYTYKTYKSETFSTLSPENQLLHTLLHGLKYSPRRLIRWIPDAAMILKQTQNFEWDYFSSQVHHLKVEWVVYQAFLYLHQHELVTFPTEIIKTALSYIPPQKEQNYFRWVTQKPSSFWFLFQLYWHSHARNSPSNNPLILLLTLPSFVKRVKRLSHWHQLVFFLCRKMWPQFFGPK